MANKLIQKGRFGFKDAFNVTSATVATTWIPGQLFKIATQSTGVGYNGVDAYVSLQTTSGAAVFGVAMEASTDVAAAVSGMDIPSGSKATILHGHSMFEIENTTGAKCYEDAAPLGTVEAASLMDPLYCSATGKFTDTLTPASGVPHAISVPIGFITKVPSAGNDYTLGVVLYG